MDRRIKTTKRDRSGRIVALCNAGQPWSPRAVGDVVNDIKSSKKSYYVKEADRPTYVRVISRGVLQTTPDQTSKNHLDNLPTT